MGTPEWDDSLPYALWRAHQVVQRSVTAELESSGATINQLGILVHLHLEGPRSASDLGRRFRITPQSAALALRTLEQRGWTTSRPHPTHGRVVLHEPSPAGVEAAEDAIHRLDGVNQRLDEAIGEDLRKELVARLVIVDRKLGGPRDEGDLSL
ncbi:MarR family winged helix-turn-helix transcriptional regulator [Demequina sp. SYSU T00192]|uniref:MarR family winged helix-turn-helix transcriptional regulator n=1 Tax=Demequina litoralis TaxID=3051660 RepID=A0ABT8GB70_9MICO|nr:MarR family winged helix-turn-helix transcriptional regulator [Demequina sp. SYSU T00192]MDN4476307.1 MarR family winged helix-turn-helix transcriptional regulator [Demequina sp. SYSU T00192]